MKRYDDMCDYMCSQAAVGHAEPQQMHSLPVTASLWLGQFTLCVTVHIVNGLWAWTLQGKTTGPVCPRTVQAHHQWQTFHHMFSTTADAVHCHRLLYTTAGMTTQTTMSDALYSAEASSSNQ